MFLAVVVVLKNENGDFETAMAVAAAATAAAGCTAAVENKETGVLMVAVV